MKKLMLCGLSILILVLATACKGTPKMTIMPSEFSKETQEVLKIIEKQLAYYDYNVEEAIQSYRINIWNYNDGEWVDMGGTNGEIVQAENQVAIQTTQTQIDIFTIEESGSSKATFQNQTTFNDSMVIAETKLMNPTDIVAGEEIPLWIKVGNEGNSIRSFEDKAFRKVECTEGIAVTITFLEEPIENAI